MPPSPDASSYTHGDEMPLCKRVPPGYFGGVQISALKRQELNQIVQRRLKTLLADDKSHTDQQQEAKWKIFRCAGDLKVYQRRLRGRWRHEAAAEEEIPEAALAVERGFPSMRVEGTVQGSVENILYGFSANTQADLLTGLSFTSPLVDAALLNVVEKSTEEDPLRSAEVIWLLTKLPILHARDFCYLKATGSGIDRKGRRYGYMVLHSVNLPECPPFDYSQTKTLRAKMFCSYLFRETSPGYVDIMGRGVFDLDGGELLKLLLPHAFNAVVNSLLQSGVCGEAKKFTLLALRNAEDRNKVEPLTKNSVCSMCIRRNQRMVPGARLRPCDGCGVPVCKRCKIKDKRILLGTTRPSRSAVCCMTCVYQLKNITGVRLGAPEFLVEAEYYSYHMCSEHSVVAAIPSLPSSESSGSMAHDRDSDTLISTTTDSEKLVPSVAMTNSTLGDSCASFDLGVSFSDTPNDGLFGYKDDEDLDELLKTSDFCDMREELEASVSSDDSNAGTWTDNDHENIGDFVVTSETYSKPRPVSLLEWMKELQSSADVAYSTAKANEELMKKSMR
ncbi:START-like domain [Plasmopara halstedii]|uniref:START-like domain n=1 Tax=Plasmopara halstedii TaxID=4781 RepID=A0A0P1B5I6_PLAHL|nr:START-like domain [Plasmopara halstedii]CEG49605.1 START-like domain [Plasmopara halstedii]|eukprot:XP_024585974.1 START-like domain [Plasmopara halstedii]